MFNIIPMFCITCPFGYQFGDTCTPTTDSTPQAVKIMNYTTNVFYFSDYLFFHMKENLNQKN